MPDRRVSRAPEVVPLPRRVDAGRAARRALLESIAARAIAALDAMDAPGFDLEAEPDDDNDAELSAQPATLAPDRAPARRIRRRACGALASTPPPPATAPVFAALFGIGRNRLEAHADAELLVLCAHYEDAVSAVARADAATITPSAGPAVLAVAMATQDAADDLLRELAGIQPRTVSGLVAKAGAIRAGLFLDGEEPRTPETAAALTLLRQIAEGPWA